MEKKNEMNGVLDYIRAHAGWTGPGEPLEDDKTNEMGLPFRHRIRNSSPGGLRGSPQYWTLASQQGINILFLWNLKARVGLEPAIADFPKQAALNTAPVAPPKHNNMEDQTPEPNNSTCSYNSKRSFI